MNANLNKEKEFFKTPIKYMGKEIIKIGAELNTDLFTFGMHGYIGWNHLTLESMLINRVSGGLHASLLLSTLTIHK